MKSVMWMIALALVPIAIGMGCSTDNILSYDAQLKKDLAAIDKYLDANNITGVTEDVSGLRIVVTEAGSGLFPGPDAKLTVKYKGSYLNGTVFTDPPNPQTFTTPLSGLIQGWQVAFVTYIAKGGKATLYIPSGLAYGRAGSSNGIPPNSNLIFEIELIGYTY